MDRGIASGLVLQTINRDAESELCYSTCLRAAPSPPPLSAAAVDAGAAAAGQSLGGVWAMDGGSAAGVASAGSATRPGPAVVATP
jgi:hypothetical protein